MKLPRDLSGTEVARRLAHHYGLPRDAEPGQPHDHDADGGGEEHHVTVPQHRDVRVGTLDAIIADVAAFLGPPQRGSAEHPFRLT